MKMLNELIEMFRDFTAIEKLVLLVILGILLTIVYQNL